MASPDTDGAPPAAALAAPHSADSDGDGDCDCDGDSMFVLGELPPLVLLEGEGVPEATDDEQAAAAFAAFAAPAEAAAAASAADGLVTPRSGSKGSRKVEFINDTRRRSSAFCKRRDGLTKKFAGLCQRANCEGLMVLRSPTGCLFTTSSERMQHIAQSPDLRARILNALPPPLPRQSTRARGGTATATATTASTTTGTAPEQEPGAQDSTAAVP